MLKICPLSQAKTSQQTSSANKLNSIFRGGVGGGGGGLVGWCTGRPVINQAR